MKDNKNKFQFGKQLLNSAKDLERRIVFSDGNDIRLAHALKKFLKLNNSECILLGNEHEIFTKLSEAKINKNSNIRIIDPLKSSKREKYEDILGDSFNKRKKNIEKDKIRSLVSDNSYFASLMLRNDDADCGVAGSLSSTEKQMKAIINALGMLEGKKYLSGAMIEEVPDCPYGQQGVFLLADVAIIPEPNEEQLLDIILSSYEIAKSFFKSEPEIAVLSYSTKGSAKGQEIEKISRVINEVRKINSEIIIDGELQFDAAIVPKVSKQKSPDSIIGGRANVLIFPCLDSANIGCKIIHRLARANVYGTIIQGASKPFNDLSRGCSEEDIIMLSAMTLLQLKRMEQTNQLIR